ncbi:MAG: DUF4869 domain-containing protein [Acetatifactor sp.]|nr:DUF4869 domain-containing protein [Acetatifactor sp.]
MPEAVYNTAVYFKNVYEENWITQPLSRAMIVDVDKSEVLRNAVIDSPVMGKISPLNLSGGVKTLLLMSNVPDRIFNASTCGDNCVKWILKIAETRELTVNLRHLMNFGEEKFDIHILNTDRLVHDMRELVMVAGIYV